MTALSDTQRSQAGQTLLHSADSAHHIIGLELIKDVALTHEEASIAFHEFVSAQTNFRTLTIAINIISSSVEDNQFIPQTVTTLDRLINQQPSPYIEGSALLAKARLAPEHPGLSDDLHKALGSQSNKLRNFGLQTLSHLTQTQDKAKSEPFSAPKDGATLDLLNAIADDPNADYETRRLALKLMRDI